MSDHIADVGEMVGARDVLAASLWLIDREIAGAPLPHPSWETFRENDPETAMIYETQAGCHIAALSAAGWAVVPVEPTPHMVNRGLERADIDWRAASEDEALSNDEVRRIYRAMIAAAFPAAPQEDSDDA